jgi:hypothetical protein
MDPVIKVTIRRSEACIVQQENRRSILGLGSRLRKWMIISIITFLLSRTLISLAYKDCL